MNGLVSIIIPAYNAEATISRCLDSCLCQIYDNIEIIVIDDASVDNTAAEIKKYKDKRIKFIAQQDNRGQSAARNKGISLAQGNWIGFVDADDTIEPDFYKNLVQQGKIEDADICVGITRYQSQKKCTLDHHKTKDAVEFIDKIGLLKHGGACDKLYKTQLIRKYNILFPEGLILEDNYFNIKAFYWARKVVSTQNSIYNYKYNSNSTMHSASKKNLRRQNGLKIAVMIMDFVKEQNLNHFEQQAVKEFILKNIVDKKHLLNEGYYKNLISILGNQKQLNKLYRHLIIKKYFNISYKKKIFRLFGYDFRPQTEVE